MIKVAAITSGKTVPSSRFRVRQHASALRGLGIDVREYAPAVAKYDPEPERWTRLISYGFPTFLVERGWRAVKRLHRAPGILGSRLCDVTWLERELLPGRLTEEHLLKRPLVFDVDDALWLSSPHGEKAAAEIARMADIVLAGNRYIADWFGAFARDVRIVPTAVDTERFRPGTGERPRGLTVGWIGTSSNLPYLESVEAPLRRFLSEHADAALLVVSDRPPSLRTIPPESVRFARWSMEGEADALREMDLGIMPLPDNEWTRGKCSFKMLQYMATGIPAIASPVGMNREVLAMGRIGAGPTDDDGWYKALSAFHADPQMRRDCGREGRAVAESNFGIPTIANALAEVFRDLA